MSVEIIFLFTVIEKATSPAASIHSLDVRKSLGTELWIVAESNAHCHAQWGLFYFHCGLFRALQVD